MVYECAAGFCNSKVINGSNRSFHRFPREPERAKIWLLCSQNATLLEAYEKGEIDALWLNANCALCSDHFEPSHYTNSVDKTRRLNWNAVPMIPNIDVVLGTSKDGTQQNSDDTVNDELNIQPHQPQTSCQGAGITGSEDDQGANGEENPDTDDSQPKRIVRKADKYEPELFNTAKKSRSDPRGALWDTPGCVEISQKEATTRKYAEYQHAVHGMIYTMLSGKLWDRIPLKATCLMTNRFDGCLGFPGGLVDPGEILVDALNRECKEELGLKRNLFHQSHHIMTHINEDKKLILHFYAKKIAFKDFCAIEQGALAAEEWGIETLGTVRVPLYTMEDGYKGLPLFLNNQFAGSAKTQLLTTLQRCKILSYKYLETAVQASRQH